MTGGAFLIMAGVVMYPTGKHSLYPGIPIPVTSLNRHQDPAETNVKIIIADKINEPKEKLEAKLNLQDSHLKEDEAIQEIPTEKEKTEEPLEQLLSEECNQTQSTAESKEVTIPVATSENISQNETDDLQKKLVSEVVEELGEGESQEISLSYNL